MKKIILCIFLFSNFISAQTFKGVISINPKQGIGDQTELSTKARKPIYHSYTFSKNISIQKLISEDETTIDTSYVQDERVKDQKLITTNTTIRDNETIEYKNFNSNVYRFESSKKDRFLKKTNTSIKDSIPKYKWILGNETQTIAGYTCKKATTTRDLGVVQNITAWYCEEIPISDGPSQFNGLPGLILQIEIGNYNTIKFEKIKFLKDENVDLEAPENKVKMVTIKQYITKMMNGG